MRKTIRIFSGLLVTALVGTGCSDMFQVNNPGSLTVDNLDATELYSVLAVTPEGVVCDAWDYTVASNALQSDDVTFIGSFTYTELHMWGYMEGYNATQNAVWNELASSHWIAGEATSRLQANDPSNVLIPNGIFWQAFAQVALADHYDQVPLNGGAGLAPDDALEATLSMFDNVASSTDSNLKAAALATKARVNRSLYFERGSTMSYMTTAMANATAALAEKSDFNFACHYAAPGSENQLSNYHRNILGTVIDPRNVAIVDPVSSVLDPRISVGPAEVAAPPPHTGMVHTFTKYPGLDADLPVSRWQEARLILAEGYLLNDQLAEAVVEINLVRAGAGLSAYASTVKADIYDQLKYERRLEFIVEGRRLQDHRYYGNAPWQWDDATKALGTNRRWDISAEEIAGNDNVS